MNQSQLRKTFHKKNSRLEYSLARIQILVCFFQITLTRGHFSERLVGPIEDVGISEPRQGRIATGEITCYIGIAIGTISTIGTIGICITRRHNSNRFMLILTERNTKQRRDNAVCETARRR